MVDYDRAVSFNLPKTYSWPAVHTANSIWDKRVKESVEQQLAAKGWTQVPARGDVQLVAVHETSVYQEYDSYYDGFSGVDAGAGWENLPLRSTVTKLERRS